MTTENAIIYVQNAAPQFIDVQGQIPARVDDGVVWLAVRGACRAIPVDAWGQQKRIKEMPGQNGPNRGWALKKLPDPTGRLRSQFAVTVPTLIQWLTTITVSRVDDTVADQIRHFQNEFIRVVYGKFGSRVGSRDPTNDSETTSKRCVYFIIDVDAGTIKIGTTRDVDRRLRALTTGAGRLYRLLGTMSGGRRVESLIHDRFASLRRIGEWFNDDVTIRLFINQFCTVSSGQSVDTVPDAYNQTPGVSHVG